MISPELLNRFVQQDAPKIEGWFYPADMLSFAMLDGIQEQLRVAGSLCEVGVYEGKSAVLLSLLQRPGEMLYGFDLFPGDMLDKAQRNLRSFGKPAATRLLRQDAAALGTEGLAPILGEGLRFLHIDAGHEYHEVLHQLALFTAFVRPGGCIAMDDYHDREFPGIEAAVLDFCEWHRPRRFVPFFAGGNKMYLCEAHNASTYQRMLLGYEQVKDKSRITRVRDFTILVGFSKLPVPAARCLEDIAKLEFPRPYDADLQSLGSSASRFSQVTFGSGKSAA